MDAKDLIKGQLNTGDFLLNKLIADLNEEEFLRQLPEKGQNVTWVFGHLSASEDWTLNLATGVDLQVSEDIHEMFKPGSIVISDPDQYPSRQKVVALHKEQRERTLAAIDTANLNEWDNPAPKEIADFFPTIGDLWGMLGTHMFWHIGHITAIRRMLKKPNVLEM